MLASSVQAVVAGNATALRVCTLVLFIYVVQRCCTFQVLFSNVVVVKYMSLVLSIAEDDAFNVYEEVLPLVGSWGRIALGLGLPPRMKSFIAKKHPNDPKDCLLAVVEEWLMGLHNVQRYGHPSWRGLVQAVAHPAGGANPALAHSVAAKHPGTCNYHAHVSECLL